MKTFKPDLHERIEERIKRKIFATHQFHDITPTEEKEVMDKMRGKLRFYSLTLQKVKPDTVATTFIVRTYKPIKWIDFIQRISIALEDIL